MMTYFEKWCKDLLNHKAGSISQETTGWGECRRHTGPSIWYAKVKISLAPSDDLQVVDQLSSEKSAYLRQTGWYDEIVYGVLDVMMTDLPIPMGTSSSRF